MFKPMLATDCDQNKLRFPLLASAKLDGIRAVVRDGVVYSRSNKPIPSNYVQEKFKHLDYADGELIVGEPTAKDAYRNTTSHVMAYDKRDFDVRFYAFDHILQPTRPYSNRHAKLHFDSLRTPGFIIHEQHVVTCLSTLLSLEERLLDLGYEGLILRDPNAPYKYGRSTVNEGYLLKLKRFTDADFEVVGFEERMHNGNEATINELGRTKRSSHQENKIGRGDLGAIIVRHGDSTFNVGTGFDDSERTIIWRDRESYLGKVAKVKYFAIGMKDAPRHPVFLGWRDKSDI